MEHLIDQAQAIRRHLNELIHPQRRRGYAETIRLYPFPKENNLAKKALWFPAEIPIPNTSSMNRIRKRQCITYVSCLRKTLWTMNTPDNARRSSTRSLMIYIRRRIEYHGVLADFPEIQLALIATRHHAPWFACA